MGHRPSDRPYKPGGTKTYTSRKRQAASTNERARRAKRRLAVVREGHRLLKDGYNKRESWELLKERSTDPDCPFSEELPSLSTYYRWLLATEERASPSLTALIEKPKPGRPRKELPSEIASFIKKKVKHGYQSTVSSIYRTVERRFGDKAPSEYLVRRFINELDPAFVSGSRHGSKAAIADSMPKLTVPADFPHQYWVMDELHMPFWVKAWHPGNERLVSAKPYAAAVIEAYSRALISLTLFRPWNHNTEGGYDSDDILATFASAALPEVAFPPCTAYAGFLPEELRMDNHSTHFLLRDLFGNPGQVTVAGLRSGSPWAQGIIEALVDSIKELVAELEFPGLVTKFLPADRATLDPRASRSRTAASTSGRQPRQIMVAVEDLLSFEEAQEHLQTLVREYNSRPHSGLGERTPEDVYHSSLRSTKELSSGHDLLYYLNARTVTMSDRLEVLGQRFAPQVNGRLLTKGEKLVVKVDPQKRGLWVVEGNDHWFVPTLDEYSRTIQPGEHVRNEHAKARAISDDAQSELEESVEEKLGVGAVERGKHEAKKHRKEKRERKKEKRKQRKENATPAAEVAASPDTDEEDQAQESGNGKRYSVSQPVRYSSPKSRIRTN